MKVDITLRKSHFAKRDVFFAAGFSYSLALAAVFELVSGRCFFPRARHAYQALRAPSGMEPRLPDGASTGMEPRLPDAQCMHKENTMRKSEPGALKSVPEHPACMRNGPPPFLTHFSPVRIVVLSNTSSPYGASRCRVAKRPCFSAVLRALW